MSTSAIKTIVEHSRLIDRTPLTALEVAPEHSFKRAAEPAFAASNSPQDGWPGSLRSFRSA